MKYAASLSSGRLVVSGVSTGGLVVASETMVGEEVPQHGGVGLGVGCVSRYGHDGGWLRGVWGRNGRVASEENEIETREGQSRGDRPVILSRLGCLIGSVVRQGSRSFLLR